MNVLVGLLANSQGTLEFIHDPTSKIKLETREGLRISKTNELLPCVMSGSPTILPLIIHLLDNLSKDAHVMEYEGERGSGTLALGSECAGGVCVRASQGHK
jgi:hypothetical protein